MQVLASDEDDHGFHYTDWTSLAWVVLVGAIIWLFTSFMLLTIAGQMQGKEFLAAGTLTKIETIGDAVLAFFCYTATIDLSVRHILSSPRHTHDTNACVPIRCGVQTSMTRTSTGIRREKSPRPAPSCGSRPSLMCRCYSSR
uniref:Uncharacterized protein n=1 Tax=Phaeomonas parva TaxID=124430 RepID=A0A7S1U3J5_9STRA|mmetsp:Transcript_29414/g.94450  ORF Transcript_29414/g.94450 Transcript_29414/m.94450 type:complete len:142 (+) Transcript_29414:320-745(+)